MSISGKKNVSKEKIIRSYADDNLVEDFFRQSHDIFCIATFSGYFIKCNPAFVKLMEYSEDELTSKTFFEFIHPEDREYTVEAYQAIVGDGTSVVDFGNRYVTKSGRVIWLSWTTAFHPEGGFIYATARNLTEIKEFEALAKNSVKRLNDVIEGITDGFFTLDHNWNISSCNESAAASVGMVKDDILGKNLWELLPLAKNLLFYSEYQRAVTHRIPVHFQEFYPGIDAWFEITAYPIEEGLTVFSKNITEKKQQELLVELEREVLELNAISSTTLKQTIDHLVSGLENIIPRMMGSVLLLDEERMTMRVLSAPSLPESYNESINGASIGPNVGSCGTAMYTRNTVIVSDISVNPFWESHKKLAGKHGLRACWSVPLIGSVNQVLGSFAIYYKEKRSPTQKELSTINRVSSLVRIIVENKKAEEIIHFSNTRYDLITSATNDMIWDWDLQKNEVFRSARGLEKVFGVINNESIKNPEDWHKRVHPDDTLRLKRTLNSVLKSKSSHAFEVEYRILTDAGNYSFVYDRGHVIRDDAGKPIRIIGAAQNINERKRFEQQLLEQEVNKQRLIAKATIEGQERERIEIGKELHDNINQVLTTSKLLLDLSLADPQHSAAMVQKSRENILHAINEIRRISKSLVPPSIGDLGLKTAVTELVETIALTTGLQIDLKTSGKLETLLDNQKLSVFRIIQEQLNNVIRHAEAQTVTITISIKGKLILLTIADNGKGFSIKESRRGVGLSNILNRSEIFGGTLEINSAPGEGCTLQVSMPVQAEKKHKP